jgi:hypothetical protein
MHHSSKKCKNPRVFDGCGCICDLRAFAHGHSDWLIARLVGGATYAQLLDCSPGLYEPFPDFRTDGNSATSLPSFLSRRMTRSSSFSKKCKKNNPDDEVPIPPNLVSTVLSDDNLTPADLKRLLIQAAHAYFVCSYKCDPGCCCGGEMNSDMTAPCIKSRSRIDPRIEPLLHSSNSYYYPQLNLGDIFLIFIVFSFIISISIAVGIKVFWGV